VASVLGEREAGQVSEQRCPRSAAQFGAAQVDALGRTGRGQQDFRPLRQQRQKNFLQVKIQQIFYNF